MTNKEIINKIKDLKDTISYIHFQDFISKDDYDIIEKYSKEIEELEKQLKGIMYYAYIGDSGKSKWYLCGESNGLCWSSGLSLYDNLDDLYKDINSFPEEKRKEFKIEKIAY